MGTRFKYNTADDVFADLASDNPAFKGLTYRKLGTRGMALAAKSAGAQVVA
jgi:hypothetical protein